MDMSEGYGRGIRTVTERPLTAFVALVTLLLLFDLVRALATGGLAFSSVATLLWDGIMRGLVIALAGIGLSMTYSILNFANFSHGDFITAGAFVGWATTYAVAGGFGQRADIGSLLLVGSGGSVFGGALGVTATNTPVAVVAGLVVAGLFTVALALFVDRFVYRPLRGEDGITLLITSIGVAFALRYIIQFVFGPGTRGTTASGSIWAYPVYILDGTIRVDAHDLTLLVVVVGLMLGVHVMLQRTKLGKAMRAMADNKDLARVTGIPTERVIRSTWIIGGGLTGVAGYIFVLWKGTIGFNDGWLLLLLIFAAVILGGIGSIYGAIVGGLAIGITASLSIVWLPTGFARAAAFFVMIVILLVRPQGIFAGRSTA